MTIRLQAQFFPPKERLQRTSQCPESHTRKGRWSPSLQRRNHSVLLLHGSLLCHKSAQHCSVPCRGLGAEGSRTKLTCSLPALSPQVSWEDPTTQSGEHREGVCSVLCCGAQSRERLKEESGSQQPENHRGGDPGPDQTVQSHRTKTQFWGNRSEMTFSGLRPAWDATRSMGGRKCFKNLSCHLKASRFYFISKSQFSVSLNFWGT